IAAGDAEVTLNGLKIGNLGTATAAAETALNIGTGWDAGLVVAGNTVVDGSGNVPTARLSGTLFSNSSDSNAGTNTIVQGDTLAISGGPNGIDTPYNNDTSPPNLDPTKINPTTFGSGSAFPWTFAASRATNTSLVLGDISITATAALTTFSGD